MPRLPRANASDPDQPDKPHGDVPRLVRRVFALFRHYRRRVAVLALLIIVSSAIGVVNPLLTKSVFDNALFPEGGPDLTLLYVLVGVMIVIALVGGAIGVFQTWVASVVGQRVMQDLRDSLYSHLQRMSLRFFTGTRTGEIQSRIANDVGGIQSVVTDTASSIFANIVIIVSTLVAMAILSWQLMLLSLVIVPFFVFMTYRVGRARRKIRASTQQSLAEMSAITEETLSVSGVLLTKVFDRSGDAIQRYRDENRRLAELQVRQQMVGRTFWGFVQASFSIAPALVYLVAGLTISNGDLGLTAGTIVAFTALQQRLFWPVGDMLRTSVEVQSSLALFERVFQYLDLEHEIVDAPNAKAIPKLDVRGDVRFRDVYFRYDVDGDGSRPWTLDGIDLAIAPGQLAALVGPSGAGKTTMCYLIPRLYDVTAGAVEIDGHDVREVAMSSLADAMGMVTQETYLFHTSVRENLLYANPEATQEELEAAARTALIHDRIIELDEGYDTLVGERGYRMSGGEKQRLAIARVILKDPRILILDEATSSLDTTSERLVQRALQPLMEGRTTIAIAHRLSTILSADVIFVVDRGSIVERGTHEELLEVDGLYASLYREQFAGGLVEARAADGVVLASGEVVEMAATAS